MVATLHRPTAAPPAAPADAETHAGLLDHLELPPATADSALERRRRAEALAAITGGDREPLETLRAGFLDRLHRASDDFEATDGLRVVELALSMIPRPAGLWAWQSREGTRRKRGERGRSWARRRRRYFSGPARMSTADKSAGWGRHSQVPS
ncbi:MAG: hypothetical protein ACRD1D_08700 [Acidimicrobiales bacterium]